MGEKARSTPDIEDQGRISGEECEPDEGILCCNTDSQCRALPGSRERPHTQREGEKDDTRLCHITNPDR